MADEPAWFRARFFHPLSGRPGGGRKGTYYTHFGVEILLKRALSAVSGGVRWGRKQAIISIIISNTHHVGKRLEAS